MADRRPDLRALVLNYRGAEMTMQVVRDLLAMDDVVLSIVVIDNGSGGAEQAALEQALDDLRPSRHAVDLLVSERNLGYAGR